MSIYGFDIPHDKGTPCRDYIAIQIPYPPSKVRGLWIPDIAREINSSSVQAGIIRQKGPLAFCYKGREGFTEQTAEVGDWVLIRWGAGTFFQAGKGIINSIGGWRYISTNNDVIKVYPAADMPDPATLEWTDEGIVDGDLHNMRQPEPEPFEPSIRERTTYGVGNG
jgi:hypothetical protein